MTHPTIGTVAMGDTEAYSPAMKRIYAKLAEEGGGTWATYMMMEIDEATAALSTRPAQDPVAWVIPGQDTARADGFLDAMAWQEGEFSRPLYAAPHPVLSQPEVKAEGADDWFSQVVSFLVKHDMLDISDEYHISDVMGALADNYEPVLVNAVQGIADDYMTSENHHPGYVLIPTAKFDAIRIALAASEGPKK